MGAELLDPRVEEIAPVGIFRLQKFRKIQILFLQGDRVIGHPDFAGARLKVIDGEQFWNLRPDFLAEEFVPDRPEREKTPGENPFRPVLANAGSLPGDAA